MTAFGVKNSADSSLSGLSLVRVLFVCKKLVLDGDFRVEFGQLIVGRFD